MGQCGGLLHIHSPIQMRDDGARDIADDAAATGAAHGQNRRAILHHNRRSHRRARAFSRLDPIGNRHTIGMRPEREIRQLVVQQKPAHHQSAPKAVFDGGGHACDIAHAVHDRNMRGRRQLDRDIIGKVQGMVESGRACGHFGQRIVALQQLGALRQIGWVEHTGHRHRHIIGISHIAPPIRKGEPRGIADQPQHIRVRRSGAQVRVFQQPQYLPNGQRTRGRRPHAADLMPVIGRAKGVAFLDPIDRQIDL